MSQPRLDTSKRATREILSALNWWHENRPLARDLLAEEIERAIEALADHPRIGSRVRSTRFRELRRYSIGKTGYWIYYRIKADRTRVLSLWHESRGRGPRL